MGPKHSSRLTQVREAFDHFDRDNDGLLNLKEFETLINAILSPNLNQKSLFKLFGFPSLRPLVEALGKSNIPLHEFFYGLVNLQKLSFGITFPDFLCFCQKNWNRPVLDKQYLYQTESTFNTFKILIVGDYGAGKSYLASWFGYNEANEALTNPKPFFLTQLDFGGNGIFGQFEIWDIRPGRDRITKEAISNVHGVIYLYDLTNRDSFEILSKFRVEVRRMIEYRSREGIHEVESMVIGTKCDLLDQSEFKNEKEKRLERVQGMWNEIEYFECSGTTGYNVERAMFTFCANLLRRRLVRFSSYFSIRMIHFMYLYIYISFCFFSSFLPLNTFSSSTSPPKSR